MGIEQPNLDGVIWDHELAPPPVRGCCPNAPPDVGSVVWDNELGRPTKTRRTFLKLAVGALVTAPVGFCVKSAYDKVRDSADRLH
jgi:hypothetical protein